MAFISKSVMCSHVEETLGFYFMCRIEPTGEYVHSVRILPQERDFFIYEKLARGPRWPHEVIKQSLNSIDQSLNIEQIQERKFSFQPTLKCYASKSQGNIHNTKLSLIHHS